VSGRALGGDVRLREVWAWSMYDFANSAYTTVVITAIFGAFFVGAVAGNAPWATFAWTAALSVSYAAILVTGPLIGAWADAHAAKKRLLLLTTVGCVVFTALLYSVGAGMVAAALVLVAISNYFFGTGENLIAAFLPELADSQAIGRVSGWGWSFGYLGGLAALGICLAYIMGSGRPAGQAVPVTMLITAAFFALAATPTFLFLRERAVPQPRMDSPWARIRDTLAHAQRYRDLRQFLLCILFYQAGITAVISLAAIYAEQAMKFTTQQTITLILVVNVTAAIGAFGFGYLQDAIGHVRAVALTLVGWIVMVVLAGLSETASSFWIAANLAGLCMGPSQADAALHHPNIVPVFAVGCERGMHYYSMQFIDGQSLAAVIADRRGDAKLGPVGNPHGQRERQGPVISPDDITWEVPSTIDFAEAPAKSTVQEISRPLTGFCRCAGFTTRKILESEFEPDCDLANERPRLRPGELAAPAGLCKRSHARSQRCQQPVSGFSTRHRCFNIDLQKTPVASALHFRQKSYRSSNLQNQTLSDGLRDRNSAQVLSVGSRGRLRSRT